jgi:hypothetical protein
VRAVIRLEEVGVAPGVLPREVVGHELGNQPRSNLSPLLDLHEGPFDNGVHIGIAHRSDYGLESFDDGGGQFRRRLGWLACFVLRPLHRDHDQIGTHEISFVRFS